MVFREQLATLAVEKKKKRGTDGEEPPPLSRSIYFPKRVLNMKAIQAITARKIPWPEQ